MVCYFKVSIDNFSNIIEAANTAWDRYREINACAENERDQYARGKISQEQLLAANKENQSSIETAQKQALRAIEENVSALLAKLEQEAQTDPSDMDSVDYRVLKTDDIIQEEHELRALKQRNLHSNLIRREVEKYAFSHGMKNPDFVNQTNVQDTKEAIRSIRNAAIAKINDTDCKGSYGGMLLDTFAAEKDGLRNYLRNAGVIER